MGINIQNSSNKSKCKFFFVILQYWLDVTNCYNRNIKNIEHKVASACPNYRPTH